MGSSPIPDMSLVRLYRASLWMEEDSLSAVATRVKLAPLVHVSGRHLVRKMKRNTNDLGFNIFLDIWSCKTAQESFEIYNFEGLNEFVC